MCDCGWFRAVKFVLPADDERILDSTSALDLKIDGRLLIIGGGIIGCEMATVYNALEPKFLLWK